jgi:hypothetical protein
MNSSYARILTLCVFAGIIPGLSGCRSSTVQAGAGGSNAPMSGPPTYNEEYAARNPRVCRKVTTPPTLEEAKALVQCGDEKIEGGMYRPMYLVTDLQVEMGQPIRFNPQVTHGASVDPGAPTYPIRGQAVGWQCSPVSGRYPAGKNCSRSPAHPNSTGLCERDGFGEWGCSMSAGTFGVTDDDAAKGPTTY